MRVRVLTGIFVLVIAALAFVAWNMSARTENPSDGSGTATPSDGSAGGGDGGAGMVMPPAEDPGVTWQAPKRWAEQAASGMRLATYAVPAPASGDPASCAVYYFGPGQGGGIDDNIERWIGEFENPSAPARRALKVSGMKVSRVELSGTYLAHAGMSGGGSESPSPGWTLLGAIVEGPNGALFFKLTGPTATVSPAAKEFDALLASLRKK